MKEAVTMIFVHARSLTAEDMAFFGNNVRSAVRRERRRSHPPDPIGISISSTGSVVDGADGPAKFIVLAPTSMPAA